MTCCAAVLTLGLAACGGDGGPSQATLDAEVAARMAAEAEAAATKMAAEEAAAAAEAAAMMAAEEAAAAAEERLLTDQEIANIRGLIVAANALVGTLTNDSDDAAIAAAQAAVMAASDAVGLAMRLSEAQTAMYTSHVTVSGLRLAAAEANIRAARNLARAEDAEGDIQAVADAKSAVTDAITSLGAAQTAQSASETALQTAQAAVTAAGNALGTTDDPDGEVAAYTSAQVAAAAAAMDYAAKTTALTAAQAALGAANMNLAEIAPDASELASAQAALAAAITAASNAKTEADAAATAQAARIKELEGTVAGLEKAEADRVAAAAAKAHSDMSGRIAEALVGTVAGGSSMNVDAGDISAAGTISTKDFVADPAGPPAISGWKGLLSKKEQKADTEIVLAYTNIEPPTSTSFSLAYGSAAVIDTDSVANTGEYRLDASGTTALLWGPKAKTAAGKTIGEAPAQADSNNFKGTYDGVPGTFKYVTAWTFTLDSKTASISVKDPDFLTFGWWKKVPSKATSDIEFEPFAFGTGEYDHANGPVAEDLDEMSATYEGPAAGLWASRNIVADEADYGKFTAEVELMAHFGSGDDARIGGTVDGFSDGNGDSLGDWTVTLRDRDLDATGINNAPYVDVDNPGGLYAPTNVATDPAARTPETAFGGADGTSDWQGQFMGNRESDALPAAVIGTFEAGVGAALSVTGSFAAENTKADE